MGYWGCPADQLKIKSINLAVTCWPSSRLSLLRNMILLNMASHLLGWLSGEGVSAMLISMTCGKRVPVLTFPRVSAS